MQDRETLFFAKASWVSYDRDQVRWLKPESMDDYQLSGERKQVEWLNIFGTEFGEELEKLVKQNKFDPFLLRLLREDNHRNKVIELEDLLYFTVKAPMAIVGEGARNFERLTFIIGEGFIWSIQEKDGDNFDQIRQRINQDQGAVRKHRFDYLFYLMIDAIIDEYFLTYRNISDVNTYLKDFEKIRPTPGFAIAVESYRKELYAILRIAKNLREALTLIEHTEVNISAKYCIELREQLALLIDDIHLDQQHLDSALNLIFSIQSHRLNEVMKTLTIFSVIFIPLTFMAGIYGMNFEYIPELGWKWGYFVLLGIMALVAILAIVFFRRKKWF